MNRAWVFLAVMGCTGESAPVPEPAPDLRPDLLLITFDTTRADALGVYGASPSPSPNVDRLAEQGLVFEEAQSVAPLTLPSHTSMLTGLYPDVHGVQNNGQRLDGDLPLVAVALKEAGWQTGAVVSAVVLEGGLGLNRGFDHYGDGFDTTRLEGLHDPGATRTADRAATDALAWLNEASDAPVFLWVHLYDPHHPLIAPAPYRERFDDPYAAEIAFADQGAGQVIDALRARARPNLIVVVGDHGEGRGEHGEETHGQFAYRSTLRVPLVVAGTGVTTERRKGLASVVDVAPTLLQAAGLTPPADVDGASLLSADQPDRWVYAESYHQRFALGLSELHVSQDAQYRYIDAPRPELYDWRADPGELNNLVASIPDTAAALRERLSSYRAGRASRARTPLAPDAATQAALRRLGYLDAGAPADGEALPDPKAHPDMQSRVTALTTLARTRPPNEAVPLLREFCKKYPRIRSAKVLLSRALQLSGQLEDALQVDSEMLEKTPQDPGILSHMGEVLAARGEPDRAEIYLSQAAALDPYNPTIAAVRGEIFRQAGRCDLALPVLTAALDHNPVASRARLVRGACRFEADDLQAAAADLEQVLGEDEANSDVRYLLGMVRLRQGRVPDAVELLKAQVAMTPQVGLAQAALGLAYVDLGRPQDALGPLRVAAPNRDTGVEPALALSRILLDVPDGLPESARWLEEAARRSPGDPRVMEAQSAYLLRTGQTEKALEVMVQARKVRDTQLRRPAETQSP
ncbi:MAG: sulfatase-like hydrolase/transferase [Myxococcota bacterium]